MKCPICNAENPPGATICHQCGFSLSLEQPTWPSVPTIPMPGSPEIETLSTPPEPVLATEAKIETGEETAAPPGQPSDDDLAREHIARSLEAIRQNMPDQARWELEQARDLADDEAIANLAQSQLDVLDNPDEPEEPVAPAHPLPVQPRALPQPGTWVYTAQVGLVAGAINGLLSGMWILSCFLVSLSLLVSFVAGVLVTQREVRVRGDAAATHAILAGGITGLGGWLGKAIGYSLWTAAAGDTHAYWLPVVCLAGVIYIPLAIIPGLLGWQVARPRRRR